MDRDGPGGDRVRFDGYLSGGPARWIGKMPAWMAALLLVAGTVLGIIVTLVAGQEPGGLLGFFVIVGTIAAALCIRRGKVYLLFPAPALAFFLAAVVAGKVHDAKLGSSTAGLGAGFTQWVAGIFFPAVVATIIVLLIGGGRWLLGRQLISGQSPLPAGRPAPGGPRPAPRDRRPVDPFENPAPRTSQTGPTPRQGTGPRPGNVPNGARPPRPPRDPRANRDPWGDPRLPADRTQPPSGNPRPRPNGQPQPQPQPQPRAPRPSWSPNPNPPRPSRPPRRQPPEGWTGR